MNQKQETQGALVEARHAQTSFRGKGVAGDITQATGGSGTYNVLRQLQQRYGKRIWLTEYGVRPQYGTMSVRVSIAVITPPSQGPLLRTTIMHE